MDRGSSFGRTARRLRDLDVVMYDRRGYARSHGLVPSESLAVHLADLASVLDGRRSVLIGHSLGGALALAGAAAFPELVSSVGCYEPPLHWASWWPRRSADVRESPEELAETFMRRTAGEELWLSLPSGTREQRRREGRALLADLAAVEQRPFDPHAMASATLLGYGSETADRFKRAVVELAAELPGARIEVLEGTDHGAHMSHPDLFAGFVRSAATLGSAGPM